MGVLKGRNNSGGWSNASVVYGWNSSGVKTYAKAMFMRKADNTWERGWTDCRKLGAEGGRDWLPNTLAAVYSGSCGNRTYQIPTRYTKDGCPSYDVAGSNVSAPDCNSSCFTASAVNCDGCGSATLYTANSGSGCTSYTTGSCGSWSSPTSPVISSDGYDYQYSGTAGFYFLYMNNPPSAPPCPAFCIQVASYQIRTCSTGGLSIVYWGSSGCTDGLGNWC